MRNCLFLCRWIFFGCFLVLLLAAESKNQGENEVDNLQQTEKEEAEEEGFVEQQNQGKAEKEEAEEEGFVEQENQGKAEKEEAKEEGFVEQQNQEESEEREKSLKVLDLQGVAMTYENALKALNTGSYFEAQVILENLLEKNPENKDFLILLAEVFYRQKDYNLATNIYKKLTDKKVKIEQKDLLLYADALLILGEKEAAIPILDILSNKMGDVESLYKLGRVWLDFGDSQNALSAFNAAYLAAPEAAPEDFEDLKKHALQLYAQELKNREEKLNAKRLERERKRKDKERIMHFKKLKQMFLKRRKGIGYEKFTPFGKMTEKEKDAELFKVSMPSHKKMKEIDREALSFFNKGNALLQQKSFKEAAVYYQLAIDKQNDFAEAFYQRGVVFYLSGQYKEAIDSFAVALKYRKYFPRALFWQAHSYQKAKVLDKAMDTFLIARKMAMQSGDVYVILDSLRLVKDLHQQGVRSRFQIEDFPKKKIVWDAKKKLGEEKGRNFEQVYESETNPLPQ